MDSFCSAVRISIFFLPISWFSLPKAFRVAASSFFSSSVSASTFLNRGSINSLMAYSYEDLYSSAFGPNGALAPGETSNILPSASQRSDKSALLSAFSSPPPKLENMLAVLMSNPANLGGNIPDPICGQRAFQRSTLINAGNVSESLRS